MACEDARDNETEATPGHVRITAEGHAKLRRRLELTAFGLDLIGWYHSHPTFPARFSSVDTIEQSTLKDPNHLGIVVSGIDNLRPYGVYKGPGADLLTPQNPIRRSLKELSNVAPAIAPADTNALGLQLEGTQANRPPQTVAFAATAQAHVPPVSTRRQRPVLPWQAFAVAGVVIVGFAVWITSRVNSVENRLATLVNRRDEPGNLQTGQTTPAPENGSTPTATPPQGQDEKTGTVDLPANPKLPVAKPAKSRGQNTERNRARRTNRTGSAANRRASSSTRQPSPPPQPRSTSRSPKMIDGAG